MIKLLLNLAKGKISCIFDLLEKLEVIENNKLSVLKGNINEVQSLIETLIKEMPDKDYSSQPINESEAINKVIQRVKSGEVLIYIFIIQFN
jgi:hypothetical protein